MSNNLKTGGLRIIPNTDGSQTNKLQLADKANDHSVNLRAPDTMSGDVTYTLPGTLGTAGQVLTDAAGTGVLSWGAYVQLSGDLGNSVINPYVIGLQGVPICTTAPTDGQVLKYSSSSGKWCPAGGGSLGTWIQEVPSGMLNGTNVTFTTTHTPITGSLSLFLNIPQGPSDYSLSGNTITFTVAPKSTDAGWFIARYQY